MKKLLVCLALLFMSAPAFALDTPTWRASATATGKTPVATLAVQPGDVIMVFVTSSGHTLNNLNGGSVSDNIGANGYWDYGGDAWISASGKYNKTHMYVRGAVIASAATVTFTANITGASTCLMAVVAVSGLSLVTLDPDITGTGTHTVRQQKNNGQDQSGNSPFMPSSTPAVPLFGQTSAYLSTSLLFAALGNESNPQGVTAPSGWTQQINIATTSAGKSLSMSIATTTNETNYLTTWGSTTATRGNACTVEVQPLQ